MIRTLAHKETRPCFLPWQIVHQHTAQGPSSCFRNWSVDPTAAPITGHFPMGPSEPPIESVDPKPEALAMSSPVGGFASSIGDDGR